MKKSLAIGLIAGALVIGLLIAFGLALLVVRSSSTPKFANTATVVLQIQSLSELVTVKYVLEKVIVAESPKTTTLENLLPGQDDRLVLLAHGIVKAGVDLSKLKPEDIEVTGEKIRVRLPPAYVTDGYLDENATQVLDRQTGLLRKSDRKLEQQARQEAQTQIARAARQNNIEREANERAAQQLTLFLKTFGYKEVEVVPRTAK
jgi:hypothetical protein